MGREFAPIRVMETLCAALSLDPEGLLTRSRAILRLYRGVASIVKDKATMTVKESGTLYKGDGSFLDDIKAGLSYLADFEPEHKKKEFEARVAALFETHWMIAFMNEAAERVRGDLDNGNTYYYILYKCYFERKKCKDSVLQDFLSMAPSTFYDYKRAATLLFGIHLWGYGTPGLNGALHNVNDLNTTEIPE